MQLACTSFPTIAITSQIWCTLFVYDHICTTPWRSPSVHFPPCNGSIGRHERPSFAVSYLNWHSLRYEPTKTKAIRWYPSAPNYKDSPSSLSSTEDVSSIMQKMMAKRNQDLLFKLMLSICITNEGLYLCYLRLIRHMV